MARRGNGHNAIFQSAPPASINAPLRERDVACAAAPPSGGAMAAVAAWPSEGVGSCATGDASDDSSAAALLRALSEEQVLAQGTAMAQLRPQRPAAPPLPLSHAPLADGDNAVRYYSPRFARAWAAIYGASLSRASRRRGAAAGRRATPVRLHVLAAPAAPAAGLGRVVFGAPGARHCQVRMLPRLSRKSVREACTPLRALLAVTSASSRA